MLRSLLTTTALAASLSAVALPAQAICALALPMVETSVSANPDGTSWHYDVYAQGRWSSCGQASAQVLTDFYLPYFTDMGLANVVTEAGWTITIEATNDVFGLGGGAMHFSTAARPASFQIDDLATTAAFDAAYDGTKGPFLNRMYDPATGTTSQVFGDPLIPASPLAVAALQAVPEPASALLLAAGLLGVGGVARRRNPA